MPSIRRNRKYYGDSASHIWPAEHPVEVRPRAKKDTKRWCLGKVGREHVPILQRASYADRPCHVAPSWWRGPWACFHRRVCDNCGKVVEHSIPINECPDNPNRTDA